MPGGEVAARPDPAPKPTQKILEFVCDDNDRCRTGNCTLKVLPNAFASDPDRLARFRREAQVLASLNHPNIAHVYVLEELKRLASTR